MTATLTNDVKHVCKCLYKISIRNAWRRKRHKSFKFLNEFIPASKGYLSKQHMDHLMGMDEVEDPIPPQMPKQKKQKKIEPFIPLDIEYQQTFPEFSILSPSIPRFVELHLHLEGTINKNTLWDLYKIKKDTNNIDESISFSDIDALLHHIQSPISSEMGDNDIFYDKHRFLCEILRGNYEGIEQVAYELCQRQYRNKIYYTEIRFNPYLLCASFHSKLSAAIALNEFDEVVTANDFMDDWDQNIIDGELRMVIESVINGLQRGCKEYNIKIYPLLSCLRYRPDLSWKLVDLAFEYRDLRNNECHIVGIDLFGGNELRYHSRLHYNIFKKCKKLGLKRTVHCGDAFDAHGLGLLNTIHQLNPERIAYCIASKMPKHILHRIFKRQLHLELTPQSNAFQFPYIYDENEEYDISDFMYWITNNSANFSISTDFPLLLDNKADMTYLNEINRCMIEYNLSDWEIAQSVLNAARAAFINVHDKNMLLLTLRNRWKAIAPNIDRNNFFEQYEDKTWDNNDLLQLNLLK